MSQFRTFVLLVGACAHLRRDSNGGSAPRREQCTIDSEEWAVSGAARGEASRAASSLLVGASGSSRTACVEVDVLVDDGLLESGEQCDFSFLHFEV